MTYLLVAHHEDKDAWEGGKKYVVYLVGLAKTFLLAAIIMTYMITGTLDFQPGGIFTTEMPRLLVTLTYIFFLIGFAKAGMMPFHNWLSLPPWSRLLPLAHSCTRSLSLR